jgi:RNA recognition motif-containing protein
VFTPKERDSDKPRNFSFICYRKIENAEEAIRGMNGRVRENDLILLLLIDIGD